MNRYQTATAPDEGAQPGFLVRPQAAGLCVGNHDVEAVQAGQDSPVIGAIDGHLAAAGEGVCQEAAVVGSVVALTIQEQESADHLACFGLERADRASASAAWVVGGCVSSERRWRCLSPRARAARWVSSGSTPGAPEKASSPPRK